MLNGLDIMLRFLVVHPLDLFLHLVTISSPLSFLAFLIVAYIGIPSMSRWSDIATCWHCSGMSTCLSVFSISPVGAALLFQIVCPYGAHSLMHP